MVFVNVGRQVRRHTWSVREMDNMADNAAYETTVSYAKKKNQGTRFVKPFINHKNHNIHAQMAVHNLASVSDDDMKDTSERGREVMETKCRTHSPE